MKIATWNVNSLKARLGHVLDYLREESPDVLLLQELKCTDENFPEMEIGDAGYNTAVHGQKTYNGVAILSKHPIEDVMRGLPGNEDDDQARYIEATIGTVRVASIYLPNGNPAPGVKYDYKLAWMRHLINRARELLALEETFVLAGDYNVCPIDDDCWNPAGFAEDALCLPQSRALYRELVYLGLTDAWRAIHGTEISYSYWDYQRGAWPKDHGVRIDHLLLSPQAADLLNASEIDSRPRAKEKPSDHTPVWCDLEAS